MRSRYLSRWLSAATLSLAVSATVACTASNPGTTGPVTTTSAPTTTAPLTTAPTSPAPDPAAVHADELGVVPVLMYHQLLADPKGAYDQTPAQFRAELEWLYGAGFRTVTAGALAAGHPDVPAGRSPMVLTFDDSTTSQYAELPDGTVDPRCAVGILLDVARRHGEPHPVASFYVNAAPFGGKDRYLASLARMDMELGDHTATHANLRQLDDTGVQRELVQGLAVITGAVPGVRVTTMALPFGVHPKNRSLAHHGAFGGTTYDFRAVLLVGSNPSRSPYRVGFDPLELPRIRSGNRTGDQSFTSTYWLPRLLAGRFVSDGDPRQISFPRAELALLAPALRSRARPY